MKINMLSVLGCIVLNMIIINSFNGIGQEAMGWCIAVLQSMLWPFPVVTLEKNSE